MLSTSASTAVAASLELLRLATERQEALAADASSGLNGWWAETIGADSATAALRTNASAARTLYTTMRDKAERLDDDTQAQTFVKDVGSYADTRAIEATANFLKPSTAAKEVAKDTAKDVAKVAQGVGGGLLTLLKGLPLIIGGVLAVWLFMRLPKKKAAP